MFSSTMLFFKISHEIFVEELIPPSQLKGKEFAELKKKFYEIRREINKILHKQACLLKNSETIPFQGAHAEKQLATIAPLYEKNHRILLDLAKEYNDAYAKLINITKEIDSLTAEELRKKGLMMQSSDVIFTNEPANPPELPISRSRKIEDTWNNVVIPTAKLIMGK